MKKLFLIIIIASLSYLMAKPISGAEIIPGQRDLVNVSGRAVSSLDPDIGLPDAMVSLFGLGQYETITDEMGQFQFTDVFSENSYLLTITAENHFIFSEQIYIGDSNMFLGDFVLLSRLYLPENAQVSENHSGNTFITWDPPEYPVSFYNVYRGFSGDEANYEQWLRVATGVQETHYEDTTWCEVVLPGLYKYCVRAVFDFSILSDPAFTNEIDYGLYHFVYINVTTYNGASSDGAIATLDSEVEPYHYEAVVSGGIADFPEVYTSLYTLEISLEGYQTYIQSDLAVFESMVLDVQLWDIAFPPANLEINELTGIMTWDEPAGRPVQYYHIYLDGNPAGETAETEFDLSNLELCQNGIEYTAGVSAYYPYDQDSEIISDVFTCHWCSALEKPVLGNLSFLESIYPNPFNPETNISFAVNNDCSVVMEIYNLKGQKVETLINEEYPAGQHHLNWKANKLPSGIYFLRSQIGSIIESRKLVLLK